MTASHDDRADRITRPAPGDRTVPEEADRIVSPAPGNVRHSPTEPTVAVTDRHAIVDALTRYATALDSRDWPLLRRVFTPDATADYGGYGGSIQGHAAIEDAVRAALEHLDASQHVVTNHVVEVTGDTATSTCYLVATHYRRGVEGGGTYTVGGTYHDTLARMDDGWRITARRLEVTWTDGNRAIFRP